MHPPLTEKPTGALRVFVRLLFAGLITYVATQAHGWAGGYAADPRLTFGVWLGLSMTAVLWRDVKFVALIALATQALVHLAGTSACTMHHAGMMSSQQMLVAHTVVGIAAAALMINVDGAIHALDRALVAIARKFTSNPIHTLRVQTLPSVSVAETLWRVHGLQLRNVIEGRGPPVFV